jgi:hypothetical protein
MVKARAFFRSFELKHHHQDKRTPSPMIVNSSSFNDDNQLISLKINPRDLIVHRVINIDDKLPLNYFQQKYKQYLKPSLLLPKQYYNDLLNKRYYSSSFTRRYDENKDKLIIKNDIPSIDYRLEIKPLAPILRPSSSSMSTWNQCVRRLNTEYRLTIDALEQVKQCLKQAYSNPIPNKKSVNVTFNLSSPSISNHIEQSKILLPCIKFSQPKLIKPIQLDTFPLSSKLTIDDDDDDKFNSVSTIIKKFNSLTSDKTRIHFPSSSITTYEIPKEESIVQPLKSSKKFISRIPTRINSSSSNKLTIKNSRIPRPNIK